jgi:lathosterol oxidase
VGYWLDLADRALIAFALAFGVHLLYYVAATGWVAGALRLLGGRKIQQRQASRADVTREILSSLRTVLIFSVLTVVVYFGASANIFTVYRNIQPVGAPYLIVTVAAMLVAQDAYFYWTHRLLHHRRLFARCHRTHHQSVTPTTFAAYAFDVPEALVLGLFAPLWLLVVPMQQHGLWIFLAFMIMRNAFGHCGAELVPRRVVESRWLCWLVTNTHHDLHHTSVRYNFGLYFTWWDRLMGTEAPAQQTARPRPVPPPREPALVQARVGV